MINKIFTFLVIVICALSIMPKMILAAPIFEKGVIDALNENTDIVASNNWDPATDENSLHNIVATVIQVFLGILATIFVLLLIVAGFNWMTAAGDEKKVEKAKTTIKTAVIGLVLILGAYILTYFIFLAIPDGTATK